MPSKTNPSSGEKNRFRFVLVEGEVAPGELQLFAHTLAAAIRPPHQNGAPPVPRSAPVAGIEMPKQQAEPPNLFDGVSTETEPMSDPEQQPPAKQQNGAKRKYRTPQPVSDLESTSGPKPLVDYIREIAPSEHSKRYLAITYWLREYRSYAEVSGDHIYTCYRLLGLNVPEDVGSILRALKKQGWVEQGSKSGFYKITHIGENQLTKPKE